MKNVFAPLNCSTSVLAGVALISLAALAAALYSEVALNLEPCILCIYQRAPYAAVILAALTGLAIRKRPPWPRAMVGVSAAAFLINSGIALYHTGVEQKWWASKVEGCTVPGFGDAEPQSILENILSAPTGRCDEIPWQDPLLGLSMANYNVILCLGLFIVCAISFVRLRNAKQV